jgi:hypothetical protein
VNTSSRSVAAGQATGVAAKKSRKGYSNLVIGKANDCNARKENRKPSQVRNSIRGNQFVLDYHKFVMYHYRTDSTILIPTRCATLGAAACVETERNKEGGSGIVGQAYAGSDRIGLQDKLRSAPRMK